MRTERRIGRPFFIDSRLEKALAKATLKYPDGTIYGSSASRLIPPPKSLREDEGLRIHLTLDQEKIQQGLKDQGLTQDDVVLSVMAGMDRLRRAQELAQVPLSKFVQNEFVLDLSETAPLWVLEAFLSSRLSLSVYLRLVRNVEADPLRPNVQSTWLSRAKFNVGISEPSYAVTIQPLGEDQYQRGVPRGAYSYLEIQGNCTQVPTSEFKITVYLDADVFGALKQYESSLGSSNAQAKLELVVLEALLRRVVTDCLKEDVTAADWESLSSQDPNPAVVGMIKSLAKSAELDPKAFFSQLLDDPEIAISHVGKILKVAKQDIDLMKPLMTAESE
jgi:hypothetical protein